MTSLCIMVTSIGCSFDVSGHRGDVGWSKWRLQCVIVMTLVAVSVASMGCGNGFGGL